LSFLGFLSANLLSLAAALVSSFALSTSSISSLLIFLRLLLSTTLSLAPTLVSSLALSDSSSSSLFIFFADAAS